MFSELYDTSLSRLADTQIYYSADHDVVASADEILDEILGMCSGHHRVG